MRITPKRFQPNRKRFSIIYLISRGIFKAWGLHQRVVAAEKAKKNSRSKKKPFQPPTQTLLLAGHEVGLPQQVEMVANSGSRKPKLPGNGPGREDPASSRSRMARRVGSLRALKRAFKSVKYLGKYLITFQTFTI